MRYVEGSYNRIKVGFFSKEVHTHIAKDVGVDRNPLESHCLSSLDECP